MWLKNEFRISKAGGTGENKPPGTAMVDEVEQR